MRGIKKKKVPALQEMKSSFRIILLYRAVLFSAYILGVFVLTTNIAYANGLFENAGKLLNDVYLKFVGMSTAAAGVGVGTGTFMKKLSLGVSRIKLSWETRL